MNSNYIEANASPSTACTSFIYLPLKSELVYNNNNKTTTSADESNEMAKAFFDDVRSHLDEHMLLFMAKISQVVIVDRLLGTETTLTRQLEPSTDTDHQPDEQANIDIDIEQWTATLIKRRAHDDAAAETRQRFKLKRMRHVHVSPDALAEEHMSAAHARSLHVSLAFPIRDEQLTPPHLTYPVFAFLPVRDLGLPFLVNAHFALVTSRADLVECALNKQLLDAAASLLAWSAAHDPYVRSHLYAFLPHIRGELMSAWWKHFVDKCKCKLAPVLDSLHHHHHHKYQQQQQHAQRKRLRNPELAALFDWDAQSDVRALACAGIELLDERVAGSLSLEQLEYWGLHKLSLVDDVLDVLACDAEWAGRRTTLWWEELFKHLCHTLSSLDRSSSEAAALSVVAKVKASPIFLIRPMLGTDNNRQHSGTRREALEKTGCRYFVCSDDASLRMWRAGVCIVDTRSSWERKCVSELLALPELNKALVCDWIVSAHLCCRSSLKTQDEAELAWHDLSFLKANYAVEEERVDRAHLASMLVPVEVRTSAGWTTKLVAADSCVLTSLLGYDFATLPLVAQRSHPNRIDLVRVAAKRSLSFKQTLEWELFLLRLGCRSPVVDLDKLDFCATTGKLALLPLLFASSSSSSSPQTPSG